MSKITKIIFILTIATCLHKVDFAQSILLKGSVTDTTSNASLSNAVIYLKKLTKPVLVAFTRADKKGDFLIENVLPDKYIMVVTYPGYVDWVDTISLSGKPQLTIPVFLMTKAHLLEEVIVRQRVSPIRIKGDTTEFLADSFHVRPGATVEDLIRVLPGMSVNGKGQITSYGQKVQNVFVDGEEFFGNDPTIATQNLNKSDVAKIQVFDKKSDKAILTGIDDGVKQKTINVILKDDAKRGYFGEVSGGTDFNNYYNGKTTISRFTSSLKMGALFVVDRTGREGASFQEEKDFGTSTDSRQGIPESMQAAVMFNKKYGAMSNNTANNYSYNHLNVVGNNYTSIKYVQPDSSSYSYQNGYNRSSAAQHIINSKNEIKIDSFTTLTLNAKARSGTFNNNAVSDGEFRGNDNSYLINTSHQSTTQNGQIQNANADIFLKRLLNKKGTHFITLNTSLVKSNITTESYLYNKTEVYKNGSPPDLQIVDQKKNNTNETQSFQALASYVNPLSKAVTFNLNYTLNISNSNQDNLTYENRNGKYDSINPIYSNHFIFTSNTNMAGAAITFKGKTITLKTGIALQNVHFKQNNRLNDSVSNRNYTDVFPTTNLAWKYSKTGNFSINYSGKTVQPTLNQLQPVFNNNDPFNIQAGNPELRPSFSHLMDIQFDNYQAAKGRIIRGAASISLTQNDFSVRSNIDNTGKRVYQTINVDGNYYYKAWITYGRNFKFMHITASIQPNISGNRYISYINGLKNVSEVFSMTPTFYLTAFIDNKLDIQSSYNYEFRQSKSSINIENPTNYDIQSIWMYVSYYPNAKWTYSSSYSYNIRQKLSPNDVNTNAMIWNLSIERKLSQKQNISAILRLNDILDQNIGFSREITNTSVTENTYTTIQRYVMLTLRWKFNKNRLPNN